MPSATTKKPPEPASDALALARAVLDASDALERARERGDWLLVYEALETLRVAHAFIPFPAPTHEREAPDARP